MRIDNLDGRLDRTWRKSLALTEIEFEKEIELVGLVGCDHSEIVRVQGQRMLASASGKCNQRLA